MGTPDGMGYIALFCITLLPAALLLYWLYKAVKCLRAGDRREGLRYAAAFAALLSLFAAAVLIFTLSE